MKRFAIIFIIDIVLIDLIIANVELPCSSTYSTVMDAEYSCSITDIPGDLTQETVLIRPDNPKQTVNVTIHNVRLGRLPQFFFQLFPNVKYLTLNRCSIRTLNTFEMSSSLQWLHLPENLLTEIGKGQLSRRIRILEVTSNRIRKIHERAFEEMTELIWINLASNRIQKLPLYVFTPSITYINLERNKIASLGHVFRDLFDLTHLNLAHNRLREVTRESFQGLPSLIKLDLSWNRIETIDTTAFDTLKSLEVLSLSGNQLLELIIGLPSPRLQVLSVDRNVLYKLVVRKSQKWHNGVNLNLYANDNKLAEVILQQGLPLKQVFLQNNNLKNLLPITGLKQLQEVDMSGNDLSRVNFKDLISIPNLEVLTIRNTQLQPHQLQQIFNLNELWLIWLDVSNNTALANFGFGDTTDCHIETLVMNSCNLVALHSRKIKQTLKRLRQLVVNKNKFTCDHLKQQIMELKAVDVFAVGDFTNVFVASDDRENNNTTTTNNNNNNNGGYSGDGHNGDVEEAGAIGEAKNVNGIRCY